MSTFPRSNGLQYSTKTLLIGIISSFTCSPLGICGERKSMWNKLKLKLNSKVSVVNFTSAATFPRIPYKRSTVKRRKTMCFSLLHSPSLRMTRCNEER